MKDDYDIPVHHVSIKTGQKIADLMNDFKNTGFNAKRLGLACQIYEMMLKDTGCIKIMTLAGAMVPAGMRNVITGFIKNGFVDILVTTGANLTHDVIETLGCHHLQGSERANDKDLYKDQMNRIYNVYLPNEAYEIMEDFIQPLEFDLKMPLVEFLDFLGKEIKKAKPERAKDSIIVACHEKKIPIYCPAFTDCALGIQLLLNHPGLQLDLFADLKDLLDRAWDMKKVGVFIVGGGVPKNFTFQALQFSPNSARYAIQITTDRPEPGGLSGATLNEAISWGKVNANATTVTLICDATIALPLILSYLIDKTSRNPNA
ncbi:MAG: deoxyhypusine synthase family protein [Promethearchaeota archaeon]